MRRPSWWYLVAFLVGVMVGGAGVHQLNHVMVQTAGAIARDVAATNRALAATAARQQAALSRVDRAGLETCPEWRVATLAAEPASLRVEP